MSVCVCTCACAAPDPDIDAAGSVPQRDPVLRLCGGDLPGLLLLRLDCPGTLPRQGQGSTVTLIVTVFLPELQLLNVVGQFVMSSSPSLPDGQQH